MSYRCKESPLPKVLLQQLAFLDGGHAVGPLEEIGVENIRHQLAGAGAAAAVLHHDAHCDLGVLHRAVGDDGGVGVILTPAAHHVVFAALGGAGLAGDGVGVIGQARHRLGGAHHPLLHDVEGAHVVRDDLHHFGGGLLQHFAGVGVQQRLDKVGAVAHALVGDGGRIGGQLDRRDHRVALADGGLDFQRGGVVGILLGGQAAGGLAHLHPGGGAQAQPVGVVVVDVAGGAAAHIVEKDVAAPLDGGDYVDVAAVAVAGAAGVVIAEIVVHAVAVDGAVAVDDAAEQGRHRHRRLKGGAGGVQPLQRPVVQGQAGVGAVGAVLGAVEVLVIAGVVGAGQDAAVFDVDDHHRAGAGVHVVGVGDLLDVAGQGLVHRLLELAVDGEHHRLAGLGLGGDAGVDDDAVAVPGDGLHAVLAAELLLIGGFQARNADDVVHGVAAVPQGVSDLAVFVGDAPHLGSDLAHPAQHMGQDGAVGVAADAGLGDLHAGQRQTVLLDGGHRLVRDVLGQGEVVDVGKGFLLHLVVDAAQNALPGGVVLLQLVFFDQAVHHIVGGGVLLQAQGLLDPGDGVLVARAVGVAGKGVQSRPVGIADQEGVVPAFAVGLQDLHRAADGLVQVVVADQQAAELHVVAGSAGGDAAAGAVHDVPAGRRHVEAVLGGAGGPGGKLVPMHHLQKDQPQGVQGKDHRRRRDQQCQPAHHGFVFIQGSSAPFCASFRAWSDHAVVDFERLADPAHRPVEGGGQHRAHDHGQGDVPQVAGQHMAVAGHGVVEQKVAREHQPDRPRGEERKVEGVQFEIELACHRHRKAQPHDGEGQQAHRPAGGVVPHQAADGPEQRAREFVLPDGHRQGQRQQQNRLGLPDEQKARRGLQDGAGQQQQNIQAPLIQLGTPAFTARFHTRPAFNTQ